MRWMNIGDTGGAAMGRVSTDSHILAMSDAQPTGHPLPMTSGGPSTRKPAEALTSRSRSQRTTQKKAKERQSQESSQPQQWRVQVSHETPSALLCSPWARMREARAVSYREVFKYALRRNPCCPRHGGRKVRSALLE